MEPKLNIKGLFGSEQELHDIVKRRRVCYDTEPYYNPTKKGGLVQIGFQINLYGTFPEPETATPDDSDFSKVLRDVRIIAEALSNTCDPLHMCEATIIDSSSLTYSPDRKMRPDVTVHIPVFDQKNFGHPVDENTRNTVNMACRMLEDAGVHKTRWQD